MIYNKPKKTLPGVKPFVPDRTSIIQLYNLKKKR